jgi:hypothetical protein
MSGIRTLTGNGSEHRRGVFDFTVILLPVADESPTRRSSKPRKRASTIPSGFQVTVPLLPGVITYGRTEEEAIAMARDAIRCHLRPIPRMA